MPSNANEHYYRSVRAKEQSEDQWIDQAREKIDELREEEFMLQCVEKHKVKSNIVFLFLYFFILLLFFVNASYGASNK